MRILMVALDLNPPWIEGIRNAVRALSLNLIRRGHEIYYVTRGSSTQPEIEVIDGIEYHRVNVGAYETYGEKMHKFFLKAPSVIRSVVKEHDIDVVHSHSSYPAMGTLTGFSALSQKVGKVMSLYSSGTSHEGVRQYSLTTKLGLKVSKSNRLTRLNARLLDKIVATSHKVETQLLSLNIPSKKVVYLPLGVDLERFNPKLDRDRLREELKIATDDRVVFFAGDLTPWKGAEILLRAVRLIKTTVQNLKVILLTKGTYEYEKERLHTIKQTIAELNLEDGTFILGRRDDIPYVHAASDAVVMPFLDNYALMDIPLSLLEAMACGKPVIASRIGGIPEVVKEGETGLLVEPGDEKGLARALIEVLTNEGLAKKLGFNERKLVVTNHCWNDIAEKMEETYQEVSYGGYVL